MNVKGQDANTTQLCLALAPVAVYGCVRSLGSDEGFANIIIWVSVERWRTSTFERRAQVWVKFHYTYRLVMLCRDMV